MEAKPLTAEEWAEIHQHIEYWTQPRRSWRRSGVTRLMIRALQEERARCAERDARIAGMRAAGQELLAEMQRCVREGINSPHPYILPGRIPLMAVALESEVNGSETPRANSAQRDPATDGDTHSLNTVRPALDQSCGSDKSRPTRSGTSKSAAPSPSASVAVSELRKLIEDERDVLVDNHGRKGWAVWQEALDRFIDAADSAAGRAE